MKSDPIPCLVDDCPNESFRRGYCFGHYKRQQRGVPLSKPVQERGRTPWDSLEKAILEFADAADAAPVGDAVKAWRRIRWRLRRALDRYNSRMSNRGLKKHGR